MPDVIVSASDSIVLVSDGIALLPDRIVLLRDEIALPPDMIIYNVRVPIFYTYLSCKLRIALVLENYG